MSASCTRGMTGKTDSAGKNEAIRTGRLDTIGV